MKAGPHREDRNSPSTALMVDDSPVDRCLVGTMLQKHLGLRALFAADGVEALAVLERETPGVVLSDLQMRGMDGLQLVGEIRSKHPLVPVILITAYGSEEIVVQALRRGAASYVPKRCLARDLINTVEQVLAAARVDRRRHSLLECLTQSEAHFVLENDSSLIPALVSHFQEYLLRLRLCDQIGKTRVSIALEEALLNALYHGNLEISSALRQQDDSAYYQLARERSRLSPYRERRLHVQAKLSRTEAVFVIRDEGPGFNPDTLPDPRDSVNLGKANGRGLLLIRTFMDEVNHNASGNEITMVKRRDMAREETCAS